MSKGTNGGRRSRSAAPTLHDVAKRAGVSSMTVSRVINGATTVRDSTRQAVEAAIMEIGYTPNENARSLAGAAEIRIAMLYRKPSAFVAEFLFGGIEQFRSLRAQAIVEKCPDLANAEAEIERIVADGVDGILMAPPIADLDSVIDLIEAGDIPAVLVTSSLVRPAVSSVGVDAYKAAREMTRYLLGLGHERIGFITGHPDHATSARRLAGFSTAMRAAGLEACEDYIVEGDFTYRSGFSATEHLLGLASPPTAIFASNDEMASAASTVAHRLGLDIPADLSICGYDDTPLATTIWPQLTTIHVPMEELTRAAADLLVRKIQARRRGDSFRPEHVLVDFELVIRESTAPPGAHRN